jgi:hypothetical protein
MVADNRRSAISTWATGAKSSESISFCASQTSHISLAWVMERHGDTSREFERKHDSDQLPLYARADEGEALVWHKHHPAQIF